MENTVSIEDSIMKKVLASKGVSSVVFLSLFLAACGGGGGSDGDSEKNKTTPPLVVETPTDPAPIDPLPTDPVDPEPTDSIDPVETDYTQVTISSLGNQEQLSASLLASNMISLNRKSCGLGGVSHDEELAAISRKHAMYLQYLYSNGQVNYSPHYEYKLVGLESISGDSNPYFTGGTLTERIKTAGYTTPGLVIAENITQKESFNSNGMVNTPNREAKDFIKALFAAPYHLQSLVNPSFDKTGTSVITYTPFGKSETLSNGFVLVNSSSGTTTNTNYPENGLITYPCEGVIDTSTALWTESPSPVAGTGRNLRTDPIGHPVYIFAPEADKIKVSNIKFYDTVRKTDVPIDLIDDEIDPQKGTVHDLPENKAFILPITDSLNSCGVTSSKTNCGLYANTKYTVSFDLLVDDKTLQRKSFSFTTGDTNY